MSWLIVFFGFCFLIIIHEAGHFVAAKATGMRAEKFFLFFGPTIWSFKRGETEYGIKSIPLGGFVKITGMTPDEEEIPPEVEDRAYYRQPVWKRIVVVAAGPAVNMAFAFLILTFAFNFYGQEATPTIEEIVPGSPAAKALRPGDRILAVDGHSYPGLPSEERVTHLREDITSHKCVGEQTGGCVAATPARLTIKRGEQTLVIPVKPEYNAAMDQNIVGVGFGGKPAQMSFSTAVEHSWDRISEVTSSTGRVISHLYDPSVRSQVSGVVGISAVGHQAVDSSVFQALVLLGLVSLSLALVNLLPLLPLDGGHIFWALVEKVRGKPISTATTYRVSFVGLAFAVVLMVIGLSNDIGRLLGEGFGVR